MKNLITAWLAVLVLAGCAAPWTVKPGADPIVVNAEQISKEATDTIDDFIKFVDRNWAAAGSDLRAARMLAAESGPVYIRQLRAATKQYKAVRNPGNASSLQDKITALQGLLETIREHYNPKTQ